MQYRFQYKSIEHDLGRFLEWFTAIYRGTDGMPLAGKCLVAGHQWDLSDWKVVLNRPTDLIDLNGLQRALGILSQTRQTMPEASLKEVLEVAYPWVSWEIVE